MTVKQKTKTIISKVVKGYKGNPKIKRVGTHIEFTEEQKIELRKCKRDPIYFIRNYCKIVSLDRGLVPFELFQYQIDYLESIHNNRKVVAMFPRQAGKTMTTAGYLLWYSVFNSNKNIAIMANKAKTSREILSRYQGMFEHLPIWMQQGVVSWNRGDVELENGSKVFTGATTKDGIRGQSCNILYIDECAIIPNNIAEEFFAAVYPVISAGNTTKVLITSTPKGYNHFWKIWTEAEQKQNGFVPVRAEYWQHPERDKAWADEQLRTLGEIKFNQEVLMHFLGSAHTLINGVSLGNMAMKQPLFTNENLEVIMEPLKGHSYVIVADTSRGVGGDYSAFTVIDVTEMPYMVVAKYRDNKISPLLYPDIIYRVANDYNEAYVLVEINDNGQQIADILFNDLEYENMFLIQSEPRIGQKLTTRHADKVYWGIKTTNQVKRIGCSVLKTLIEGNKLLIFDKDIISELSTFVETRGSYAADEGYHDDLVMCLVLFAWLSRQPLFVEMTNVNMRKELFEREQLLIEQDLTPFGYIDDGIEDEVVVEVEDGDLWVSDTDPDSYFRQLKDDMLRGH